MKPGAYEAAVQQRSAMSTSATGGSWAAYGISPEIMDNTNFDQSNGSTLGGPRYGLWPHQRLRLRRGAQDPLRGGLERGRLEDHEPRPELAVGRATRYRPRCVSAVAYSPAKGGTLLVLTGDDAFGFDSLGGLGLYRSTNGGGSWQKAGGVPSGVNGFRIAVDPSAPNVVYAATGAGLYRSTDDGASFTNVKLPTGTGVASGQPNCTGDSSIAKGCFLANQVTDVVVQGKPAAGISGKPGAVLATVGWRAGQKADADGTIQSPNNGVYESDTGAPGTSRRWIRPTASPARRRSVAWRWASPTARARITRSSTRW